MAEQVIQLSDDITAPACEGPAFPPEVTFTFFTTPSESRAAVGDTVEYLYCGQNTSTIPLEVVRLVDDRLGVLLGGGVVVDPGESVCNTDVGPPVTYVVQESDAGGVINNNAVVTVRTLEDTPREFQGTASSAVAVPLREGALRALLAPPEDRSRSFGCGGVRPVGWTVDGDVDVGERLGGFGACRWGADLRGSGWGRGGGVGCDGDGDRGDPGSGGGHFAVQRVGRVGG